jgi:hypothetical protein
MPGINPRPTLKTSFSAACKAEPHPTRTREGFRTCVRTRIYEFSRVGVCVVAKAGGNRTGAPSASVQQPLFMERLPFPLSSRAKPRDLRFRGPLLETRNTILKQICHLDRTRISCHAAPDMAACAAFVKESSMKCANATKFHRKSGERSVVERSAVFFYFSRRFALMSPCKTAAGQRPTT